MKNVKTLVAGVALAALTVLAANGASAKTVNLGNLNSGDISGPDQLAGGDKVAYSTSSFTDFFKFDVAPGALLTYAQLIDTVNSVSSSLSNGYIEILQFNPGTLTYVADAASYTTIPTVSSPTSLNISTPVVNLGAGAYELEVTGFVSKDLVKSKYVPANYTVGIFGTAVPEPATWAVMLMGFGAIGTSMRSARRKRAAAATA